MSQPFFAKQKQDISQEIYFRDCIIARVMLFIHQRYHTKEKVLFWPDLATSHYRHKMITGVQLVHKEWNPQNCPQSCPIETLWTILNDMVYEGEWEAKTID